jgi:Ca-activated chloride channel family protein
MVMMRTLLFSMLLVATSAEAGMDWSGLWRTPDQRGEQFLRSGDAATAARTYSDPRRKAYAELEAGDYSAAARDFAPFDDGDAHYDRGNALARNGDLQGAIKAYDAALARDPNNADARHNRELVERALKRQEASKSNKNGSSGGAGNKNDGGGNKNGAEKNSQQNAADQSDKDASAQKSNDGAQNAQGGKSGNDKNAGKNSSGSGQQPAGEDRSAQNAATTQAKDGASSEPTSASPSQKAPTAPAPADSAEEARRDAKAGIDKTPAPSAIASGANDGEPLGATEAGTAPRSEQQLAQEQWLRRIPDDPGGLLRRKFLIEHMLRQQQAQP